MTAWRSRLALGLTAASGFAGLGYQIVWTQQAALWLGHDAAAVLAVVTAFFGGLAAGALLLAPRIERSARPVRWYAACEAAIAVWGLVLVVAMAPVGGLLLAWLGPQPSPVWHAALTFAGTLVLLLPATMAMGATLPAMQRVLGGAERRDQRKDNCQNQRHSQYQGQSIAMLYACNTAGAVLGVLATAFWLLPAVGLARTAAVCAGLNTLCAAGALLCLRRPSLTAAPARAQPSQQSGDWRSRRPLAMLAATGLLGIGIEVLMVRVLSQLTEDTVYSFALLLAVYLVGTGAGAALHHAWRGGARAPGACVADRLLCAAALACLLGTASLWLAPATSAGVQHIFGVSLAGGLAAEAALAALAFGAPTIVMGMLFSELAAQASRAGIGFGRCLAVNTLGAAAAPPLFGVLLAPALGAKAGLLVVAVGYLALVSRQAWRRAAVAGPGAAVVVTVLATALWAPPLAFVDVPPGGHVVSDQEGTLAAVSVVEDADGVSRLRINNRQQEGSSASLLADGRQALLPLLLHPSPRRVLFLGLGTGITAATAAQDPALERVDAVELLPEVITASALFTPALLDEAGAARLHLLAADARRFVRTAGVQYDVIVSDNFHPARSGSGALYTVEHFRAVRARLAADGVFCQWLPLHQMDLPTLRSIVQAFVAVNPGAWAMLATNSLQTPVLGLVAHADAASRIGPVQLGRRIAASALPLAGMGLADPLAVLGNVIAGPAALRRFAGDAPINTDDHPVVAYAAPRITYAHSSTPADRLVELLQQLNVQTADIVPANVEPAWQQRLGAYWSARDAFIDAGRNIQPGSDARAMLAQVRQPLLAVLRTSPDFRPAYDPLLRMALTLARTDANAARTLLRDLAQAAPARPEAAQALLQLDSANPPSAAP